MKYLLILFCCICSLGMSAQNTQIDMDAEVKKVVLKYQMNDAQASQVKAHFVEKQKALISLKSNKNDKDYDLKKKEMLVEYETQFVALLDDKQKQLHEMYRQLNMTLDPNKNPAINSPKTLKRVEEKKGTKTANQ